MLQLFLNSCLPIAFYTMTVILYRLYIISVVSFIAWLPFLLSMQCLVYLMCGNKRTLAIALRHGSPIMKFITWKISLLYYSHCRYSSSLRRINKLPNFNVLQVRYIVSMNCTYRCRVILRVYSVMLEPTAVLYKSSL